MEIEERLIRARVQIQNKNSFFAYLSLYLKFKEDNTLPEYAGAGVDINGNFGYKPEFMNKLSDAEIQAVIIHEILHLSFLHIIRLGSREPRIFNVATDLAVNILIKNNGFSLPNGVIQENYNHEFKGFGIKLEKVNEKFAEELYDELMREGQKQKQKGGGEKGKGEGESGKAGSGDIKDYKGFDEHKFSSLSEKEKKEIQKEWEDRIRQAYTISQMKGDTPVGIDRLVGDLHKEKINWRAVLNQFITSSFPCDFSWAKPNKRSVSIGEYMPNVVKEKIDIVVAIDLSGSVGNDEFKDFFSEIVGIARAYQERCDIKIYTHDSSCYYAGLVRNGNIEKLKQLQLKGGGGTSFNCVIEKLKEDKEKPKCLIWLTDGYGDKIEKQPFPILWVLNKNGSDDFIKDSGRVIKLE